MDLSNPAASGGGEGESLVGRNKAERGPQRRARRGSATPSTTAGAQAQSQVQGAFAGGGAQSEEVAAVDEPAVPATSATTAPVAAPAEALVPAAAQSPSDVRALAKPPVRKLAKDLGIDLATLIGSGANGVITRATSKGRDVMTARRPPPLLQQRTRPSAAGSGRGASRSRACAR